MQQLLLNLINIYLYIKVKEREKPNEMDGLGNYF
jgi:hypothetical protein